MDSTGTVERAFDLARDGNCRTIEDIRRRLAAERCSAIDQHLGSLTLRKQLVALMAAGRGEAGG